MKTRNASITLSIIIILLLFFFLKRYHEPRPKEIFDRNPVQLTFTRHARCRMQCRQIDSAEIREVMAKGIILLNRSNRQARPCPEIAVQARTATNEYIRVIFAQCRQETRVITCYNLEVNYPCDCPGD